MSTAPRPPRPDGRDVRSGDGPCLVRIYGSVGPTVTLVHGGPGAPGTMAPVAHELCDRFRVLEPWQRPSGAERLSVARHVTDLHEILDRHGGGSRPALVGSSWGAMLALACAAARPDRVGPLVLVGCGTFDRPARERLLANCKERTDDGLRERLARLPAEIPDPDARLAALARLVLPIYSHDVTTTDPGLEECDARANQETWDDMLRLQDEGLYPAVFAAIESPVLMLHGAADPHPGRMIRMSLEPHLPQLEYHELARCGHYPWLEREAREEFFAVLRRWLIRHVKSG